MERENRYDAFISYHHAPRDRKIAQRLQKLLEHYTLPKSIRATRQHPHLRVFRDESDFSASANLTQSIQHALENVNFVIFICSPESVNSIWCMAELAYFKKINGGSTENILVLITGGKAPDVFPELLRWSDLPDLQNVGSDDTAKQTLATEMLEPFAAVQAMATTQEQVPHGKRPIEPFAVSVSQEDTKHALKKLNVEFLRFAATLLGCPYDTLRNRAQVRKTKRLALASVLAMVLFGAFGIYNWGVSQTIQHKNELLQDAIASLEESNYTLRVKNADILTAAADLALQNGDRMGAIQNAIAALPTSETDDLPTSVQAEYILSQASLAYENSATWLYAPRKTAGLIEGVLAAEDGENLVYYDDVGTVYLLNISTNQSKTISFAKDESARNIGILAIAIENGKVYLCLSQCFVCLDIATGETLWMASHDTLSSEEVGYYEFSSVGCQILPDAANGRVAFVSDGSTIVLDDTGALYASFMPSTVAQVQKYDAIAPNLATLTQDGSLCYLVDVAQSGQLDAYQYQGVVWNPDTQEAKPFAIALPGDGYKVLNTCMVNDLLYLYGQDITDDAIGQGGKVPSTVVAYDMQTMQQLWQTDTQQVEQKYSMSGALQFSAQTMMRNGESIPVLYLLTPFDFTIFDAITGEEIAQLTFDASGQVDCFLQDVRGGILVLIDQHICFVSVSTDIEMQGIYTLEQENGTFGVFVSNDVFAVAKQYSNQLEIVHYYMPNQENIIPLQVDAILKTSQTGLVASKTLANEVVIFDPVAGVPLATFTPEITLEYLAFLPDNTVVVADQDGYLQTYKIGGGLSEVAQVPEYDWGFIWVDYLSANEESNHFLCVESNHLTFCSVESGQIVVQAQVRSKAGYNAVNDAATYAIALQEEGDGYAMYQYDIATTQGQKLELSQVNLAPERILAMDVSEDGNTIALAHADGFLLFYDMQTKQYQTVDWDVQTLLPEAISLNPSAQLLLIWNANQSVMVYSVAENCLLGTLDTISAANPERTQYLSDTQVALHAGVGSLWSCRCNLYDLSAMQIKAEIDGFLRYVPAQNCYLVEHYDGLCTYPCYTTQSLIAYSNEFLTVLEGISEPQK